MSTANKRGGSSLFDSPELYDVTFSYRNIPREVDFVLEAFRRSYGHDPDGVLDIACGTGAHALELARRGYRACGLDISETMVEYAGQKAEIEGLDVDFRQADMTRFSVGESFDCAICMLHSLATLATNEELLSHFASVARALSSRSMYIVELGNPHAWFTDPPRMRRERWDAGSWADTRMGYRFRVTVYRDPIDYLTETARVETVTDITGRGISRRLTDVHLQRLLLPETLRLLAVSGGGLKLSDYHGDFSLDESLRRGSRSARMIGVFTRSAEAPRLRDDTEEATQLEF